MNVLAGRSYYSRVATKKIGRYEICEQLGKGGMGVVFKAFDPELDRFVAIKLISPDIEVSEEVLARFLREARSVAMFSHANIVSIYDSGEIDGHPYIVMEHVEGQDLRELIEGPAFVAFEDRIEIAAQICRGLAYAHRLGVVHRDINPRNVRISKSGKVKILDFGIARIDTSEMTRPNQQIGTPAYMSPEQVDRKVELDGRSDLFSLGVILFQLIAGRRPFEADTISGLYFQIVSQPANLAAVVPACAPELAAITEKALAKNREERFSDGDQMAQALTAFKKKLPAQAARLQAKVGKRIAELEKRLDEAMQLPQIRGFYEPALFQVDLPAQHADDYGNLLQSYGQLQAALKLESERREQAATGLQQRDQLTQGMEEACRLEGEGKYQEALGILKTVPALGPDDPQVAALRQRLQEAQGRQSADRQRPRPAQNPPQAEPPPTPMTLLQIQETLPVNPPPPQRIGISIGKRLALAAALLVVSLALAVGLVWTEADSPTVDTVQAVLILRPVPWARVESIMRTGDGTEMLDPAQEVYTPCRLALPAGKYWVRLSHPDYGDLELTPTIAPGFPFEYQGAFPGFDLEEEVKKEIARMRQ